MSIFNRSADDANNKSAIPYVFESVQKMCFGVVFFAINFKLSNAKRKLFNVATSA